MTYPRSHLVNPAGGTYHVCSRCVRRAFLCGFDRLTGRDLNHRKHWLQERIKHLSEVFAIDLFGYAIMSNHYHLVLRVNPETSQSWTNKEVARRWLRLTKTLPTSEYQRNLKLISSNQKLVKTYRERLSSLSWFMRFLNEPIARRANEEDGCTGRFWQGRFQSQQLLDDAALLACMAYVDLNPVRAGAEAKPGETNTTSIGERVRTQSPADSLNSLNSPNATVPGAMTLGAYQTMLESLRNRVKTPELEENLLRSVWQRLPTPGVWRRAIGSSDAIQDLAAAVGQRWIKQCPASAFT